MINFSRAVFALTFIFITTASFQCWAQISHQFQKETFSVAATGNQKIENYSQPGLLKNHRSKLNFNRDWKFQLGDYQGAENPGFKDDQWQSIGLPHSFSIPYFLSPDFYVGYGWYRKHFVVPAGYKNKKFSLEFEAAFQQAEVFVNHKKVGEHIGGYTGFSVDISSVTKEGDNVVAVRVNNLWNPGLAPRAGEHVFSGGIYRDVFLVITNPVHVDWYGTFITTPIVSEKTATVTVKTEIRNDAKEDQVVIVKTEIIDPSGKPVANFLSSKKMSAQSVDIIDQTSKPLLNPKLWHPDHPYLYTAVTTLLVNNKVTDKYRTTFGIRSIQWTADKGFFLNGKHLYLRGANLHQDHAGWGDAVTNAGFYRDVQMIKDAGFNFIRGSHYPHDPAFAEACDRLGVLFWSENTFWGIGGSDKTPEGYWNSSAYPTMSKDTASFATSLKQQLREMIRINRNSPSIIVWSMSNEPFFSAPQVISPMRNLLKQLVVYSHQLDPSRAAAIGGAQRPLDSTRIDILGDVAGYNGDGSTISVFQKPGVPSMVSEYGSTTAERPGNYEPGWGDMARDSGKAIHAWRSGQAIWCAFDHGSIAGSNLGKMGIVDYFRIPKRAWYWYRNAYAHVPPPEWPQPGTPARLQLKADRSSASTDGTEDIKLLVTVLDAEGKAISNNSPVELRVVSGPGEFPTGPSIKFEAGSDIRILDGQAAIELRSWYAGRSVIRATSPGLQPAEVTIDFTGVLPYKEGTTPRAVLRPYVRYNKKSQQNMPQLFGRNNPTFASSTDLQHPAGYAADGNPKTWWQPNLEDINPSWILDTEKRLSVSEINISFPEEAIYRYKVEISDNRQEWKTIMDLTNNQQKETAKQIKVPDLAGRVIRISFDHAVNARLAEVDVTGKVLD
jgi:beta-galactosidase